MWPSATLARDRRQKAARKPIEIPSGFIIGKYRWRHMTDDLSFHHVDDELGHIRRVIRDTLQVFADEGQANGARNRSRVFDHEGEKFSKQLVREVINKVVVRADFACLHRV